MSINKYQSLNVLSNKERSLPGIELDAITEVASMINNSGANRSQRRRLEKTLSKITRVQSKCEEVARKRADKELAIRADNNFMYVFACVGLTLFEDYRWKEDPDQEHGQITSFYERLTKKMEKYAGADMSTQDIIDLLEERTGINLVSDPGNLN